MQYLLVLCSLLHYGLSIPNEPEYYSRELPSGLRLQSSSNAVPRIGRRADNSFLDAISRDDALARFESMSKKGNPVAYQLPRSQALHWNTVLPRRQGTNMLPPARFIVPWSYGPPGKRSPPGFLLPTWKLGKRVEVPDSVIDADRKRSPPRKDDAHFVWNNILRTPQGFRFHDSFGDYMQTSRYKKAESLHRELNSVPLMGKRQEDDPLLQPLRSRLVLMASQDREGRGE